MAKQLAPIVLAMLCAVGVSAGEQDLLFTGVTGSVGSSGKTNPGYVMRPPEVQRLLLDIAEEPRDRSYVASALKDSEMTVEDLLALRLLREDAAKLVINFNFLTQRDQAEMVRIASKHAGELAQGYLGYRQKIEAILARRGLQDVAAAEYAFILIGCFSLDWDGLLFTDDPRYRAGATHRTEDGDYTPWAKERGDVVSFKGLYWGSHNQYLGNVNLTTFGDHYSLPRAGFPDFGWQLRVEGERLSDDEKLKKTAVRAAGHFLRRLPEAVGEIMLCLGTGAKSVEALEHETSLGTEVILDLLHLLEELEYISGDGAEYRAIIPVLTDADTPMVRDLLAIGRKVIREWHDNNYDTLASDLSHITPLKYGVPYGVVYTEVWHYVFALANQELVDAGLLADPYADPRRFKGFIPAVWRPGQEHLDAENDVSAPPS